MGSCSTIPACLAARTTGLLHKVPRPWVEVLITLIAILGTMNRAYAAPLIDQQQPIIDASAGSVLAIGGLSTQKLAQVVTAGAFGFLTEVRLPVECNAASSLVVEIQGVAGGSPNGVVLTSETVPGDDLPPFFPSPPGFRGVVFSVPVSVSLGDQFAIVLKSAGNCDSFQGPVGDSYLGGNLYFDALPNPPGWVCVCSFPGDRFDLPFQTLIERHIVTNLDGDFDGDGKTDITVFRPSTGTWYSRYTSTGSTVGFQWGNGTDVPVPGDYNGDGLTDIAVFRPSNGTWYLRYSGTGMTRAFQWGNGLDVPAPGDYNGDRLTDIAVFRPSNGTWYIWYTGTATTAAFQWGNGSDVPMPGDYNGDGLTDIAVFRPSDGIWYLRYSGAGTTAAFQWGNGSDLPIPGDFDGDGKADIAVFRPSDGTWYVWYSGKSTTAGFQWGNGSDVPVPGDFNGDGKTDIAVFRPSSGTWYVWYSGTAIAVAFQWGIFVA